MKYKLIVSDLDGTALKDDRTASEATIEAIKEYRAAGGTFIISTGRMFESIVNNAHLLGLDKLNIPICALDGGLIKESQTGKVIAVHTMPYEQTAAFAEECEKIGCYFQVYTQDKLFVAEENEINRHYCEVSKIKMNVVGKLSKYIYDNKLGCVKVLVADKNADSYLEHFKGKYSGIQFFLSWSSYLDGAAIDAGKGNALLHLAGSLGIDRSRTVAIGDSMNDISMIKAAALGVAVANADDRLKAHADMIVPSNNDDGLAYLIRKAINDELSSSPLSK